MPGLTSRPSVILANKMDLARFDDYMLKFVSVMPKIPYQIYPICAKARENVGPAVEHMKELVEEVRRAEAVELKKATK
jgi:GTPase involved in cell partitioning and DNA repair